MEPRREIIDLIRDLIGRDARTQRRSGEDAGLDAVLQKLTDATGQDFGSDVKAWVEWFRGSDGPSGMRREDLGATRRRIQEIEAKALRKLGKLDPDPDDAA